MVLLLELKRAHTSTKCAIVQLFLELCYAASTSPTAMFNPAELLFCQLELYIISFARSKCISNSFSFVSMYVVRQQREKDEKQKGVGKCYVGAII